MPRCLKCDSVSLDDSEYCPDHALDTEHPVSRAPYTAQPNREANPRIYRIGARVTRAPSLPEAVRAMLAHRKRESLDCGVSPYLACVVALADHDRRVDDRDFYELMQSYRHAPLAPQSYVVNAYEAVKSYLRGDA